ncbi:MAG: isopentenyl phosphate kinase [Anaerolineae bacterium]|nr:isopentenyl phosphate kinase [Anaerolineae bacterium]MCX8067984.1 isopentenyl phosphate kinase [Anaerolineae bacterium]
MELTFLKLGGSLITEKSEPYTFRSGVARRLAQEIRTALAARGKDFSLLIGHGSGSFGHFAARPYGTRDGVRTPEQWLGFARVAGAAALLNRLLTGLLEEAGVPAISFQPSASARCRDGQLVRLEVEPIRRALHHGLVPVVYGDVAIDEVRGGTIVSTEDLFVYLTRALSPRRILLATDVPGVLDEGGRVIPAITPATFPVIRPLLRGAQGVDVTGGMADKVERMVGLVEARPGLEVRIFSGLEEGALFRMLVEPETPLGTCIRSA